MAVPLSSLAETPGDWITLAFHILLSASIGIGNLVLILAIVSSKKLLRRNNFLYTLSITASDLLVGLGWCYNGTHMVLESIRGGYDPSGLFPMFHGVSLLTLMAAMLDRYYAVQHPFAYAKNVTRAKALAVIASMWLLSVVTNVIKTEIPRSSVDIFHAYCSLLGNLILIAIMGPLNLRLYLITKRQLAKEPAAAEGESKKRSAQLIIATSVMFLVLWTPSIIHCGTCSYFKICYAASHNAVHPFFILRVMNTLTTPVVFLCGSPMTRASLRDLGRKLCCHSNKVVSEFKATASYIDT